MQTYTDPNEEVFIGIHADDPQYIIDLLNDIYGYSLEETKEVESFDEVGVFYTDTIIVHFGLVNEELLLTLITNKVNVMIAA